MSLPIVFELEAQAEFDGAFDWYEQQQAGLGEDFLNCIAEMLTRIESMQKCYEIIFEDVRRAVVQRFPYSIFYRIETNQIADTRISLDSIVYAFRNGLSSESIVQSFPLLTLEQVYGAIAFYLANRAEIDNYLLEEEAAFDTMSQPLQTSDPVLYRQLVSAKVGYLSK